MKKDFNDFMSTLTSEKIQALMDNLPESIKQSNLKNILTTSGSISILLSLDLLRMYHDWLFDDSEQHQ